MSEVNSAPRIEDLPDGTRRIVTAVRWNHRFGREAVCLGRVYIPVGRTPVAILSEVISNRYEYPLGLDFSAAAGSLMDMLVEYGVVLPGSTRWYKHIGPFSYHETFGEGEVYIEVPLSFQGGSCSDDIREHRQLAQEEMQKISEALPIASVEEDVASVGL